ncbi:hypothetical protein RJ490_005714 [Pluralibacter gergoviae]|uniref:hypothetical protein n=1 Tax=Pluralibacter gergoviae TaxID=61647 RepID=UPI0009006750|nr:hypothetical protein [Pluralibacter gergoviae]EKV0932303.1 hypothetical protein [Pluralibacter gergoviae]ELD4273623.1 hypothetical protein [Pluralibacter gergoviae]ELD4274730.1 hypothetical protein [Pluralibacter gergoviae]ELD4279235.1 hypothetical protein [Pluralibacter gergoviae]ELD4280387.1 hypothetical protein [Pluralibacter gergoviae]
MSELHKVNRIIPAVSGWWMLYRDEEGNEWYTPVAGWAECSFFDEKRGDLSTPEELYPLVPTGTGVIEPDISGNGQVVYLGSEALTPSGEDYSTAYYRGDKK